MDATRVLLEYYKSHQSEGTLRKYIEKEAKTDPAFIPWLFYYADNIKEYDQGMNEEQRFEYNVWLDNLPRKTKRLMGESG